MKLLIQDLTINCPLAWLFVAFHILSNCINLPIAGVKKKAVFPPITMTLSSKLVTRICKGTRNIHQKTSFVLRLETTIFLRLIHEANLIGEAWLTITMNRDLKQTWTASARRTKQNLMSRTLAQHVRFKT